VEKYGIAYLSVASGTQEGERIWPQKAQEAQKQEGRNVQ
jgi:hypothetical protein